MLLVSYFVPLFQVAHWGFISDMILGFFAGAVAIAVTVLIENFGGVIGGILGIFKFLSIV